MSRTTRLRLTLVADAHGDVENVRRAVRFHLSRKCDAFLVAGDLGSRSVWPVAPSASEGYRSELCERGYFPFEVTADEAGTFESHVEALKEERPVEAESVAFVERLIERGRADPGFGPFALGSVRSVLGALAAIRKQPVLVVMGESDPFNAERLVEDASIDHPNIACAHGRYVPLADELGVVGLGRVVEALPSGLPISLMPWESYYLNTVRTSVLEHGAPRIEYPEEELERMLMRAFRAAGKRRVILLSHTPPFRSGADIGVFGDPREQDKFRVFFLGSQAVRRFALLPRTVLVGCGHVHSCAGVTRMERTTVVNPGQLRRMESPIVNLRVYRDGIAREYIPLARWDAIGCGGALVELGDEVEARRFEV